MDGRRGNLLVTAGATATSDEGWLITRSQQKSLRGAGFDPARPSGKWTRLERFAHPAVGFTLDLDTEAMGRLYARSTWFQDYCRGICWDPVADPQPWYAEVPWPLVVEPYKPETPLVDMITPRSKMHVEGWPHAQTIWDRRIRRGMPAYRRPRMQIDGTVLMKALYLLTREAGDNVEEPLLQGLRHQINRFVDVAAVLGSLHLLQYISYFFVDASNLEAFIVYMLQLKIWTWDELAPIFEGFIWSGTKYETRNFMGQEFWKGWQLVQVSGGVAAPLLRQVLSATQDIWAHLRPGAPRRCEHCWQPLSGHGIDQELGGIQLTDCCFAIYCHVCMEDRLLDAIHCPHRKAVEECLADGEVGMGPRCSSILACLAQQLKDEETISLDPWVKCGHCSASLSYGLFEWHRQSDTSLIKRLRLEGCREWSKLLSPASEGHYQLVTRVRSILWTQTAMGSTGVLSKTVTLVNSN